MSILRGFSPELKFGLYPSELSLMQNWPQFFIILMGYFQQNADAKQTLDCIFFFDDILL